MAFGVSDILEVSQEFLFDFSVVEFFLDTYGYRRGIKILESLREPVHKYAIRVNTLKTNRGYVLDILRDKGINVTLDKMFRDILYLDVKGPFEIPMTDKIVISDKFRR